MGFEKCIEFAWKSPTPRFAKGWGTRSKIQTLRIDSPPFAAQRMGHPCVSSRIGLINGITSVQSRAREEADGVGYVARRGRVSARDE